MVLRGWNPLCGGPEGRLSLGQMRGQREGLLSRGGAGTALKPVGPQLGRRADRRGSSPDCGARESHASWAGEGEGRQ